MGLSVRLRDRDLSTDTVVVVPGQPAFTVQSFSKTAIGGPERATISVAGTDFALAGLLGLLRCPVEIVDDETQRTVWWGFVAEVTSRIGLSTWVASLANMYNRCKVVYTLSHGDGAGLPAETAWSSNSASVSKYGQREQIRAVNETTAAAAANYRDTFLATHQQPKRYLRQIGGQGGAVLQCRGWWDTLGWRHMAIDSLAAASYTTISGSTAAFPRHSGNRVGESFTVASTKTARVIYFYMRVSGDQYINGNLQNNPVCARLSSGSLGSRTQLDLSASVYQADLGTDFHWQPFVLTSNNTLSAATTYWVEVGRDPASSQGVNWEVRTDEALGYSGGTAFRHHIGSDIALTPSADIPFMVFALADTTTVISDIATAVGEFIAGTDIDSTSGVSLCELRDPDANALDDIQELIDQGSTNLRRVLADVKADRRLRVREEPASAEGSDYLLVSDADGPAILDTLGNRVRDVDVPAGVWLRLAGPLLAGVLETGDESTFLEQVEWSANAGLRFRARGDVDPWDFTALQAVGVTRD